MKLGKITITSLLLLLALFITAEVSYGADFIFDYDVTYDIKESGDTHVSQNIVITNNTSNLYAQNFTLTITSNGIGNVVVREPVGKITPEVVNDKNQTHITVPFSSIVAGVGSELPFTIEYDNDEVALKKGRIWEIIIPGIKREKEIRSYTIHVETPKTFGEAAYLSPPSKKENTWTLEELKGKGITAAFGEYQHFTFKLIYDLKNSSTKDVFQEVTLPPNTNYQKILLSKISEVPENVYEDIDGNWLARFFIERESEKSITVEGSSLVYVEPLDAKAKQLTELEKEIYTKEQQFWERPPEIAELSSKLDDPEAIYDYVVERLSYDYARVTPGIERLGAEHAFNNPDTAVCMEFSDLFISLSRASGIASRELHGFAYTNNSRLQPLSLVGDVLHAWPEYFDEDKGRWIQVDPTWGNTTRGVDYFTKLDFNHIVFAILGEHSDKPYPAGSFRSDDGKKVFVDFSQEKIEIPESQADISTTLTSIYVPGLFPQPKVILKNTEKVEYAVRDLFSTSSLVVNKNDLEYADVPPYGSLEVPLKIESHHFAALANEKITIHVNDEQLSKNVLVIPPFYLYGLFITLFIVFFFVILRLHGTKTKT